MLFTLSAKANVRNITTFSCDIKCNFKTFIKYLRKKLSHLVEKTIVFRGIT